MYLSYCLNTQGSITNTSYDKKILSKVQICIPEGWQLSTQVEYLPYFNIIQIPSSPKLEVILNKYKHYHVRKGLTALSGSSITEVHTGAI